MGCEIIINIFKLNIIVYIGVLGCAGIVSWHIGLSIIYMGIGVWWRGSRCYAYLLLEITIKRRCPCSSNRFLIDCSGKEKSAFGVKGTCSNGWFSTSLFQPPPPGLPSHRGGNLSTAFPTHLCCHAGEMCKTQKVKMLMWGATGRSRGWGSGLPASACWRPLSSARPLLASSPEPQGPRGDGSGSSVLRTSVPCCS